MCEVVFYMSDSPRWGSVESVDVSPDDTEFVLRLCRIGIFLFDDYV